MTISLTACGDLQGEGGITRGYLTIKPFQCGVDHLQMAVIALQLQSMRVIHSVSVICSMAASSFLNLEDIFAGQRKKNVKCSNVFLKVAKMLEMIPTCLSLHHTTNSKILFGWRMASKLD